MNYIIFYRVSFLFNLGEIIPFERSRNGIHSKVRHYVAAMLEVRI